MTVAEFVNKVLFRIDQTSINQVNTAISGIKSTATKLLGAIGIGFSLTALNGLVEEFGNINNSIKYTINGLEDCEAVQNKLLASANNCRMSYGDLASSANALAQANADLFPLDDAASFVEYTTKLGKAAGYTDSVIASMNSNLQKVVSAGTMSSSVVSQLGQSAPALINTICNGLGVSKEQLLAMADAGTLTATKIKTAMLNASDSIDAAFGSTSMSISDALLNIRNRWGLWLAQTDETLELTQTIAKTMVSGFNSVMGVLNKVRNGVVWLCDTLGSAQNLLKLIGIAAGALLSVLSVSVVLATASAFAKLASNLGLVSSKLLSVIAVVILITLLVEDFINFMQGNDSLFGSLLENAGVDVDSFREKIVDTFAKVRDFLVPLWEGFCNTFKALFGTIADFWDKWGDEILGGIGTVLSVIGNAMMSLLGWVTGSETAKEVMYALGQAIATFAAVIATAIPLTKGISAAIAAVSAVISFIASPIGLVTLAIGALIAIIILCVKHWDDIKVAASGAWEWIKSAWDNAANWFNENIVQPIVDFFIDLWASITTIVGNIKSTIVDGFTAAIDWIKALPAQALQWGRDIVMGIVDGIKSAIGKVGEAVSGVASKIKSFIGFSEPEDGPLSDFGTYMPDMIDLMSQGIQAGREKIKGALGDLTGDMSAMISTNSEPEDGPLSDFGTYMPDMIDLMSKGIQAGREKIKGALGDLAGDMSAMASVNVVSSGTAAAVTSSTSTTTRTIVLNNTFNQHFIGDRAGQQKSAEAMDKAAKDSTAELARGLAYAR